MRELDTVHVAHVQILSERRAVHQEKVDALAASIAQIGLQTPITVRLVDDVPVDGQRMDGTPVLVVGAHRLAAAKKLGWEKIDAFIVTADDIDAELWEIDENLMRAELTPAQEADHLNRRRELWHVRGTSCPTFQKAKPGQQGFATETAARTGRSKKEINRSTARATNVVDINAVVGTSLDKGVELDALGKLPADQQRELIDRAKAGEAVSARKPVPPPADPLNDVESINKQVGALMAAWNRAGPEARRRFLSEVDKPVFDNTRAA